MRRSTACRTVLDIVGNHGSPSYTMPIDQPKFGEIYDRDGKLVADHQNLPPRPARPRQPAARFYHREPDLAELSDLNDEQPGGAGLSRRRVLAVDRPGRERVPHRHDPPRAARVLARVRAAHPRAAPGLLHVRRALRLRRGKDRRAHAAARTAASACSTSRCRRAMAEVFGKQGGGFERMEEALHLEDGVVPQSVRADDLLRQPRHGAAGRDRRRLHRREQLAVHRARHPGRLLRLGDRLHGAAPRNTRATATTSARSASTRRARPIASGRPARASRTCAAIRRRCSAACR